MKKCTIMLLLVLFAISCVCLNKAAAQNGCWKQVSTSLYSTLALKSDGTVWIWGTTDGFSTPNFQTTPLQIGTDNNWATIAMGARDCAAIKTNGTLWGWRDFVNNPIQFGSDNDWDKLCVRADGSGLAIKTNGTLWGWAYNQNNPIQIGNDNNWASISSISVHTLGVKKDGTLWAWGSNSFGELGNGKTINENSPIQIGKDNNWAKVSAGTGISFALKNNGTLWVWGHNSNMTMGNGSAIGTVQKKPIQIGNDDDWVNISVCSNSTCNAIKKDGTLWAWGLSVILTNEIPKTPTKASNENDWISVTTGFLHTIAIKKDGTLWAWAYNQYRDLYGEKSTKNLTAHTPIQIVSPCMGSDWKTAFAGQFSSYAIKNDEALYEWGALSMFMPSKLSPTILGKEFKTISVGAIHSLGIKNDGSLWAWGINMYGQFGNGKTNLFPTMIPERIGTEADWIACSAGAGHSLALKKDSTLWVWGANTSGQLGNGSFANKIDQPQKTPISIGNDKWIQIAAGAAHSIGVKKDSTLWTWGLNKSGELGNGNQTNSNTPQQIGIGKKWTSISTSITSISATSASYSLALTDKGTLWGWGKNELGAIGTGELDAILKSPTQIGTEANWATISTSIGYSAGIKKDGTLWGWGLGGFGWRYSDFVSQNNPTGMPTFLTPIKVDKSTDWKTVQLGGMHIIALKTNGSMWTWGYNMLGQLGNGTTNAIYNPQ